MTKAFRTWSSTVGAPELAEFNHVVAKEMGKVDLERYLRFLGNGVDKDSSTYATLTLQMGAFRAFFATFPFELLFLKYVEKPDSGGLDVVCYVQVTDGTFERVVTFSYESRERSKP